MRIRSTSSTTQPSTGSGMAEADCTEKAEGSDSAWKETMLAEGASNDDMAENSISAGSDRARGPMEAGEERPRLGASKGVAGMREGST